MNLTRKAELKIAPQYRSALIKREAINTDARTAELAFSSELPVSRWFGTEVLDHGKKSVDLGRLNDGGAVLWNHDSDELIGVVESARVDDDRIARAVVRFGTSERAEQVWRDVQEGIARHVSVGYRIDEITIENAGKKDELYRATRWTPYEVSIVSVPADPTVGIGRSAPADDREARSVPVFELTPEITIVPQTESHQMNAPAKTGDEAFQARAASIQALVKEYKDYLSPEDGVRALAEGQSVEQFQTFLLQKMQTGATDVTARSLGVTSKEMKRYSLVRAIAAMLPGASQSALSGAGFERELSGAIGKALGRDPEGIFVPPEFFTGKRDFTAGTAAEAGNLIQTDVMGELFTDVLRPALVLGQLGITILPGLRNNIAIPRKTVAGTLAMLAEVGAATETQPTTAQVPLSPKRISSFVEPSKQAIIQGELGIEMMLRDDLLAGAAVLIEDQGINGSGTAPNARGIRNVAGIGAVVGGTNGLAFNWSHATGLEAACANANATSTAKAGYLVNTKTVNTAKNTQKATNLPFIWDGGATPLNGYKAGVTNNVPSNLTKGTSSGVCSAVGFSSDWSMFVLALFGGLDVTVNPYSLDTQGQVRITLNQYIDWACRQPGAFAFMADALTP